MVVPTAAIPVPALNSEVGRNPGFHCDVEPFVPCRVQCFLLYLSLVDLLSIEHELAVRVAESIPISSRQVGSIVDFDSKCAHVVDTLAWIKTHLDWDELELDRDMAFAPVLALERQLTSVIL